MTDKGRLAPATTWGSCRSVKLYSGCLLPGEAVSWWARPWAISGAWEKRSLNVEMTGCQWAGDSQPQEVLEHSHVKPLCGQESDFG